MINTFTAVFKAATTKNHIVCHSDQSIAHLKHIFSNTQQTVDVDFEEK